jgi:hypothetical protein
MNTGFSDANYTTPAYLTTPYTYVPQGASTPLTMNLPNLWRTAVPTVQAGSNGSWTAGPAVPMTNLLKNMMIIRGISMSGNPGHPDGAIAQTLPSAASPSLMGAVADLANTPVPAVGFVGDGVPVTAFKGVTSSQTLATGSNPLLSVMQPFNQASDGDTTLLNSRGDVTSTSNLITQAMSALQNYADASNPGADYIYQNWGRAEALLKQGIGNAASAFGPLLAKYENLITQCTSTVILGVNEKEVPLPAAGPNGIPQSMISLVASCATNGDLRTLIQATSYPNQMAAGFAMAEYLFVNGLSSAVMIGSGRIAYEPHH